MGSGDLNGRLGWEANVNRVCIEGPCRLALDGMGYFPSQQSHCESCLERHHRNGTITSSRPL